MNPVLFVVIALTTLCNDGETPSWVTDMGPGAGEFWRMGGERGFEPGSLQGLMEGIERGSQDREAVRETIECWACKNVDVGSFLRETVKAGRLPKGRRYWHEGISQVKVLKWLAAVQNPGMHEWLLTFAREEMKKPIRSADDVRYISGILTAVATMGNEQAFTFLLEVQSESFWESEGAPCLGLPGTEQRSEEELNSGAKSEIRQSAIYAIADTGDMKAIGILGTGKGIAQDLQWLLDSSFQTAVRHHVGVYGAPEEYGGLLPDEKLDEIQRIYAEYGKTYKSIEPSSHRISPPHLP